MSTLYASGFSRSTFSGATGAGPSSGTGTRVLGLGNPVMTS